MYTELRLGLVQQTLETLRNRIRERFPDSGLASVADELCTIAAETEPVIHRLSRPNWLVRILVGLAVFALLGLSGGLVALISSVSIDVDGLSALLQAIESAAQDLIFLGIAIYFLLTVEGRLDRRTALGELRKLRAIVHIVDMHQLTKDPEHLLAPTERTASSPERQFTRFELSRYLDYCTELLSLASKLAAVHAQCLSDPVVLDAVNDIEILASNLSNKIWQKIVILDTISGLEPGTPGPPATGAPSPEPGA
jgi:hypothetical protein